MPRTAFISIFPHAADIFLNTAERFLLVCASITAGCSRIPEVQSQTKKRKNPVELAYSYGGHSGAAPPNFFVAPTNDSNSKN